MPNAIGNIFSNAIAALARVIGRGKTALTNLIAIGGRGSTSPDINQDNAIERGYCGNGVVYSVVSKDSRKFASIPRYVYSKTKGKKKGKIENSLSILLDRPNEYQGQDAFFEAVRGFYKICGESFIWLNRGDTDKVLDTGEIVPRTDREIDAMPVLEMYVLPSNRVYIIPDPSNVFGLLGYEFDSGGSRVVLRKNDVIHWRSTSLEFDPYDRVHLRGMPALRPGKNMLQQNNDAIDSATRMYQNDGARGLVFNETYNDLTVQQQSDTRDVINKRVNNNDIKGSIATVQGKWGYINFGGTAVDMELLEALKMSKRDLCMLFDVPPEFYIDTTYENKKQAMEGWVLHSIIPDCKKFDDELNRMLLKAFGLNRNSACISSDYTELPELQEYMLKMVTQLSAAWWLTPNERRVAMGYEEFDDDLFNEPWVANTVRPMSISTADDGFDDMVDELETEQNSR